MVSLKGLASIIPGRAGLLLYPEGLASTLPVRAGLHYIWKGWPPLDLSGRPPLYLEGLTSTLPVRAGLCYKWKGWPLLYLSGLASVIPGRAGLLLYLVVPQIVEGSEASSGHYFSLATGLHLLPSLWIYSSKKGLLSSNNWLVYEVKKHDCESGTSRESGLSVRISFLIFEQE
jgi:hypothetical protein